MTKQTNAMLKQLILSFLIITAPIFGSPEEYFKNAPGKSENCQIENIDFIYVINLDQRPEKYENTIDELAPFGIAPYRFSAVNGWELSLESINAVGIKFSPWMKRDLMGTCYLPENNGQPHHEIMHVSGRNYFCHCMSPGAIGIALSHLSILKDAYDSGYEVIWVMEDDIIVLRDPHLLGVMVEKLDQLVGRNGWDILFTDQDTKDQNGNYVPCLGYAQKPDFNPSNPYKFYERVDISPDLRKLGARYGAYSMIVSRSGMRKLLDFMRNGIFLPYDMEYCLPDSIQMYNIRDDIVSTNPRALSDNGAPNYKQSLLQ